MSTAEARDVVDDLTRWEEAHSTWRNEQTVNLNAATNSLSDRARAALSTSLADKGISSGLRSRHHRGGQYIDAIEERVASLACTLFGGAAAELRPPTGSLANALVIASLLRKNQAMMTGDVTALGHFSLREKGWGGRLAASVTAVPYQPNGIDLDLESLSLALTRTRPSMIFVGSQTMTFPLDLAGLREVADRVDALVVYDAAHPLGLIAGGEFQDPLAEGADILTASTQKSFPGPVGGLIVTRTAELMEPIYLASNQLMSNYQNNRVLSFGYTAAEMAGFGAEYARACIRNARSLAEALTDVGLEPLFSSRGFTASNIILLPWGSHESAERFAAKCESADLIVSTTQLPSGADESPRFGTRIGVQDLTRHGYGAAEMVELAAVIRQLDRGSSDEEISAVGARMRAMSSAFPTVYYDFENGFPPA